MTDLTHVYNAMRERGVVEAIVRYNGAGDEGYIEDVDFDPPFTNRAGETDAERDSRERAIEEILREAAYAILEDRHPGWEINEGSEGTITFDDELCTTKLHHGERIEQINWHDVEV